MLCDTSQSIYQLTKGNEMNIRRQAGPHCYINARGRRTRNWEWIMHDDQGNCLGVYKTKKEAEKAKEQTK